MAQVSPSFRIPMGSHDVEFKLNLFATKLVYTCRDTGRKRNQKLQHDDSRASVAARSVHCYFKLGFWGDGHSLELLEPWPRGRCHLTATVAQPQAEQSPGHETTVGAGPCISGSSFKKAKGKGCVALSALTAMFHFQPHYGKRRLAQHAMRLSPENCFAPVCLMPSWPKDVSKASMTAHIRR